MCIRQSQRIITAEVITQWHLYTTGNTPVTRPTVLARNRCSSALTLVFVSNLASIPSFPRSESFFIFFFRSDEISSTAKY